MITRCIELADGTFSGAIFSDCKRYRYLLWRRWDPDWVRCRFLNLCMLNPSTATEEADDPTVSRGVVRAKQLGFGGLWVTNIFGWRSTDPRGLKSAADPVGPDNNTMLVGTAKAAKLVVCAWGNHGSLLNRDVEVRRLLREAGVDLHCLKVARTGQPCHPLYLPYSLKPIPFGGVA